MAKRAKGPETRTAQPLRTAAQRLLFLLFLGSAVALMVLGRTDPAAFERARMQVTDVAAPILDALARPIDAANALVDRVDAFANMYEDNTRLRQEVERLQQWQSVARNLEIENAQMRDLLAFQRQDVKRYVTGRVIGTGGTFVRALLLNVGTQDGVRKGQVAVTGDGLIGRVAEVGSRSSRVLLITDLNSRVPVVIESSRARAILAGDNTAIPRLIYGAANSELNLGQRVVTSGDAGAFPPGLPVGVISSVDENGIRVMPYATSERPELVRLMDFGLDGILVDGVAGAAQKSKTN
ncbi:MAG: rod shape-determining protein MreC [Alphaproteobacteria bacterium]|nr:rod shape-determining protein MreC [Alphaproteobacteria bacterium]